MLEIEQGERNPTSSEIKQELLGYLKDAEFGTPKFLALADWLNLQKSEDWLHQCREEIASQKSLDVFRESQMRVEEYKVALLELKIQDRRSTLPGYAAAYSHINIRASDFWTTLDGEGGESKGKYYVRDEQSAFDTSLWEEYFKRGG